MKIIIDLNGEELKQILEKHFSEIGFTVKNYQPKLKQEYIFDDNDKVDFFGLIVEVDKSTTK